MTDNASHMYVFRNCFTGDISGGDMHTGGLCEWIHHEHPELPISLVHASNDGQGEAYPEAKVVPNATYQAPISGNSTILFLLRTFYAWRRAPLKLASGTTLLMSGSHFLPDVLPVYLFGGKNPKVQRSVYIHHIIQDMPRAKSLNNLLANWQEKLCFWLIRRRYHKIITVNQEVAERLRQMGFTQDILVSSNFVDTTVKASPLSSKKFSLAFCGRMVKQKGVDDLLKICQRLQTERPGFKAVMIGVGPELERLKKLASEQNIPITFAGRASDRQKFELISQSSLFVFPSREEGWGIAIAESLMVGTPVLAYNLPVYKAIFGDYIEIAPLGNVDALYRQTKQLLDYFNKHPGTYHELQQDITSFAKSFDRHQVLKKEYQFLRG